jgi:hypothetical protein
VKDGLVPNIASFPGICTGPGDWLKAPVTVRRPQLYFREGRPEHESVSGQFTAPLQLGDAARAVQMVRERVAQRLRTIASERAGKGTVGRKALLRQDPFEAPRNQRPSGGRNPTLKAAGDVERYDLARRALRAFREAYRDALDEFRRGIQTIFPAGTLMMRKRFKVRCAPDDFFWCCRAPAPG